MKETTVANVIKLRLAVGFLGEKDHANWWPSLWLTENAKAFLSPIYGQRIEAARYCGVVEAARVVHDSRIGVGRAFHLFRLPEHFERRLHDATTLIGANLDAFRVNSSAEAKDALLNLAKTSVETSAGPVRLGDIEDLEGLEWLDVLSAHYLAAFQNSQMTFPYYTEGT